MAEKIIKPDEMARIGYTPAKEDWFDSRVEFRRGVFNYPANPKSSEYLSLPNVHKWSPLEDDWHLPDNWKEIITEGFRDRLKRFRSLKIFMDLRGAPWRLLPDVRAGRRLLRCRAARLLRDAPKQRRLRHRCLRDRRRLHGGGSGEPLRAVLRARVQRRSYRRGRRFRQAVRRGQLQYLPLGRRCLSAGYLRRHV